MDVVRNSVGHIDKVMVKFDEEHQGKKRRESQKMLTSKFPGCTSIDRIMFNYSLAKISKKVSSTAKVIQFPLSLCFAATAHRFQGGTIRKPNILAADFRTVFEAAQAYVMLSRVETLSQLFIIHSVPESKFYASSKALVELERLESMSANKNPTAWEDHHEWSLKIASLNCHSLRDKIEDLRRDEILLYANIICLTETWLLVGAEEESLRIPGFRLHVNSIGRGKGIATYGALMLDDAYFDIKREKVQMTRLMTPALDVISIYRSQGAKNVDVAQDISQIIREGTPTIICGDLNLCYLTNRENEVTNVLKRLGFIQLVREASHLQGGHLDHVYSNLDHSLFNVSVQMYSPYYTYYDHDGFLITITFVGDNCKKKVYTFVFAKIAIFLFQLTRGFCSVSL